MKQLKITLPIKINILFLTLSFVAKLICIYEVFFSNYSYWIDIIFMRLLLMLCFLVAVQVVSTSELVKNLKKEQDLFDEGPADKSAFIAYLRKYDMFLIFPAYLTSSVVITYFVPHPVISYVLGLAVTIGLILYLVQIAVYTDNYVKKSHKFGKIVSKPSNNIQLRNFSTGIPGEKIAIVCYNCTKAMCRLYLMYEIQYKLFNGGANAVSPFREGKANEMFPNDVTKKWSESKLALAMHNRANNLPHDFPLSIWDYSIPDESLTEESRILRALKREQARNFSPHLFPSNQYPHSHPSSTPQVNPQFPSSGTYPNNPQLTDGLDLPSVDSIPEKDRMTDSEIKAMRKRIIDGTKSTK